MKKECQVILLPTKELGAIYKLKKQLFESCLPFWNPQHLYICSADEIKEGDWFMYKDNVLQANNQTNNNSVWLTKPLYNKWYTIISSECSKIIATTDSSLIVTIPKGADYESNTSLPNILQQFIKEYIEEYNKGNIITSVMVEYEAYNKPENFLSSIRRDIRLKLNGNEIIIN